MSLPKWILPFSMLFVGLLFCFSAFTSPIEYVTVAILVKDKAHTLPLYLRCLEQQTWPKEKTYLYIRTNNNNDNSVDILREWLEKVRNSYAGVYFDFTDTKEPVHHYKQHEWNYERFKVLGEIRQDSVNWAHKKKSHYFVADCDNFIVPDTIEKMVETNLPIVAPFLRTTTDYSNYHAAIDQNGYFEDCSLFFTILDQTTRGLIEVPVVHCTYLIRHEVADKMSYNDGSRRYEYVIFSDSARKQNIPQYIDNRKMYGRITFAENTKDFSKEPWLHKSLIFDLFDSLFFFNFIRDLRMKLSSASFFSYQKIFIRFIEQR